MAIFNLASVGDLSTAQDLQQVKDYLFKLQEQLRYMFANLDPDDNYASSVPKLVVAKGTDSGAKIEVDVNGITMSVGGVSEEGLIDTINTQIQMTGKCINITTGHMTISTNNFTLDQNGNATFSGNMTAGSININNMFSVNSNGQVTAKNITIGSTTSSGGTAYFSTLLANYLSVNQTGNIDYLQSGEIAVSGYVYATQFIQTSDSRLKENVEDIPQEDCVEIIKAIRPVSYDYIARPEDKQVGFIAQEVLEAMSQKGIDLPIVTTTRDDYYAITYTNFIPIIVETLQYILKKVEHV